MPDILAAIRKIKGEQPEQANVDVQPAGFLGRFLGGRSDAVTNPFTGNVSYNAEKMQGMSQPDVESIIAHELAHSRQIQNTPMLGRIANVAKSMIPGMDETNPYQRPREMEAYQAQRDRNMRLGLQAPDPISGATDIQLPPPSPRRKMLSMFTNDRTR